MRADRTPPSEVRLDQTYVTCRRDDGQSTELLQGLTRTNLFVGPNNGGKSRLLRWLFENAGANPNLGYADLREAMTTTISRVEPLHRFGDASVGEVLRKCASSLADPSPASPDAADELRAYLGTVLARAKQNGWPALERPAAESIHELGQAIARRPPLSLTSVYIGAHRSTVEGRQTDVAIQNAYFRRLQQGGISHTAHEPRRVVYTGQTFYEDLLLMTTGDRVQRDLVASFQKFLSEELFEGRSVEVTPHNTKAVVVGVGRETERPIEELGDGIQQLIILTWPLFLFADRDLMLFIEEPELYLHPSSQRALLRAIDRLATTRSRLIQLFIATHSNHLLDLAVDGLEASTFRVEKELPSGERQQETPTFSVTPPRGPGTDELRVLGVRPSSVLLANCTIWVEGITDRLYLRCFLELLMREEGRRRYTEDTHYSFVEYSGANLVHYSLAGDDDAIDVDHLCAEALVVADRDSSAAKDRRARRLRQRLGKRFCRLACREIENAVEPAVLSAVLADYGPVPPDVADRLARLTRTEYQRNSLGRFIDEELRGPEWRRGGFAEKSGTLKDKLGFARRATAFMYREGTLSGEPLRLAKILHEFISSHNT